MNPTFSEFSGVIIVALGFVLIVLLIIFFVIYHQKKSLQEKISHQKKETDYLHSMIRATLVLQENERKRLSAELHDSIGAMLSAVKLGFIAVAKKEGIATQTILPTNELIDETIEIVRKMSGNLIPKTLEKFGLSKALKEVGEQFAKTTQTEILFSEEGSIQSLNKTHQIMIYRIVQELMSNALQHSGATTIQIHFNWSKWLTFSVMDNGKGFFPDQNKEKGLGLFTIEHQARLLNATVNYHKEKSKGSKIELKVPYE